MAEAAIHTCLKLPQRVTHLNTAHGRYHTINWGLGEGIEHPIRPLHEVGLQQVPAGEQIGQPGRANVKTGICICFCSEHVTAEGGYNSLLKPLSPVPSTQRPI